MTTFSCLSSLTCSAGGCIGNGEFLTSALNWTKTRSRNGWPLSSATRLSHAKISLDLSEKFGIGERVAFSTVRNNGLWLSSGYGGFQCRAAGQTLSAEGAVEEVETLDQAKFRLLNAVIETGRGFKATAEQRAIVEEALVGVERFDAGKNVELDKLDGTWVLQYTTAPDVIQLLQASEFPFLQVGQISQKFECIGRTDGGIVKNVVRWGIPRLLEGEDGATLVVTANFSVVSPRSISLSFQEAQVGQVAISEGVQSLLAPAFLPRTIFNLQILQFFRSLNVRVPLRTPSSVQTNNDGRVPVGTWYYLTYLDRDMLVGRALASGGVFVFRRTQALQLP